MSTTKPFITVQTGTEAPNTRAAGLAEAAALVNTVMADAFQRDDCSEEFLNGMAYGVASYCSAIKALAAAQPQGEATVASDTVAAPGQRHQQAEWSRDVQIRLIDACTEHDEEIGLLMAEAACVLAALTPHGTVPVAPPLTQPLEVKTWQERTAIRPGGYCETDEAMANMQAEIADLRAALAAAPAAIPAAVDALSALLWLYRRLPRGYGRQEHIEHPIKALAAQTGTDVAADLAERGQHATDSAVTLEPPTGVRATDVAQVLSDLDGAGKVGGADVESVAARAGAVIRGLLSGLSTAQLSGVGRTSHSEQITHTESRGNE